MDVHGDVAANWVFNAVGRVGDHVIDDADGDDAGAYAGAGVGERVVVGVVVKTGMVSCNDVCSGAVEWDGDRNGGVMGGTCANINAGVGD